MTIGTGIFLSSVFIGTVVLFIYTKERWKWKKNILWFFSVTVGIIMLGGIGIWGYIYYQGRPKKLNEVWGVRIGMSSDDVRFLKGVPTIDKFGDEKLRWIYNDNKTRYRIYFMNNRVVRINAVCLNESKYLCPSFNDIRQGDDQSHIFHKLGKPTKVIKGEGFDKPVRLFLYKNYNSCFYLEQNSVLISCIYNPSLLTPKIAKKKKNNEP